MTDSLTDAQYTKIAELVQTHAGICLPPSKRVMVEGRLRRRVRALGLKDLGEYGAALFKRGGLAEEFEHLVDSVTTNKTDFFREPQHFDLMIKTLLPELQALPDREPGPLKFWSAAASTGAEAYTLAMVAAATIGLDRPGFSVLGTDISPTVLKTASLGVYPHTMYEQVPEAYRTRYLMVARDPERAEFRIVPELRRLVRFASMNLMDSHYEAARDFDLVLCRNVLIYFTKPVQAQVIERLLRHVRIGGYLLLGHSETMSAPDPSRIRQVASSVFQKVR